LPSIQPSEFIVLFFMMWLLRVDEDGIRGLLIRSPLAAAGCRRPRQAIQVHDAGGSEALQ
jgi:hypothetical protein